MAIRQQWNFVYAGEALAQAARAKLEHHRERFEWWKEKKEGVLSKIRAEGLEIDESLAMENPSFAKSRDFGRSTQVTVRIDLQTRLDECLRKLAYHSGQSDSYNGWVQVLSANPEAEVPLDHDDWLFFFGKDQ